MAYNEQREALRHALSLLDRAVSIAQGGAPKISAEDQVSPTRQQHDGEVRGGAAERQAVGREIPGRPARQARGGAADAGVELAPSFDAANLWAENQELRKRVDALQRGQTDSHQPKGEDGQHHLDSGVMDGMPSNGHWGMPDDGLDVQLEKIFEGMNRHGIGDEVETQKVKDQISTLLIERGMCGKTFERLPAPAPPLTLKAFQDWFLREWELAIKVHALAGFDLERSVAEALPGGSLDFPLRGLLAMSGADIDRVCQTIVAPALRAALARKQAEVMEQEERIKARREEEQAAANDKFAVHAEGIHMAKFGSIDDFHRGIAAQIGLPSPRLLDGMEAEHCRRRDSKDEFSPGNYNTTTTPSQEWLVVTNEVKAREASTGERIVKTLPELMRDPLVAKASLRDVEVLALLLYTGPMFAKYNAVLRGFPQGAVDALQGNKYTTTIYCIVSGIIKLSKVMTLPEARKVYRGLGGVDLPQAFSKPDAYGIRGGVEYAMLSTTFSRKVALQYAGANMPTVFEISVGAIDRGASLGFLSQYPGEAEILLPPRSYLEVVGVVRVEAMEDGIMVRVVPLKVNANSTSSTIEQIEQRRKELFVSAGENALHEIRSRLDNLISSERVADFLSHQPSLKYRDVHFKMSRSIVDEVGRWLSSYQEREAGWFNDEWQYSMAVRELSELERMATGKFDYWLSTTGAGSTLIDQPMMQVARLAESELTRMLGDLVIASPPEDDAKTRQIAVELCRLRGALVRGTGEVNDLGEPPLVAAGAKGDTESLRLLLLAGCEVDSVSSSDGSTALHRACMMGHLAFAKGLLERGADLMRKDAMGRVPLRSAVAVGHTEVVQLLLKRGGQELASEVVREGQLYALSAARRSGGERELRQLVEACGSSNFMIPDGGGVSCALIAAQNGHVDNVRYMFEQCGNKLLSVVNKDGSSCAWVAAQNGHLDVLRYLFKACGNDADALLLVNNHGRSCAYIAAQNGHLNVLGHLFELFGGEILSLLDKDGMSCAWVAAMQGHLEVVEFLLGACGKNLLMQVTRDGRSSAWIAAQNGHLGVLRYLHEVCGKELVALVNKDGKSCAFVACMKGHVNVVRFLHEVCGNDILLQVDDSKISCKEVALQRCHDEVYSFVCSALGDE